MYTAPDPTLAESQLFDRVFKRIREVLTFTLTASLWTVFGMFYFSEFSQVGALYSFFGGVGVLVTSYTALNIVRRLRGTRGWIPLRLGGAAGLALLLMASTWLFAMANFFVDVSILMAIFVAALAALAAYLPLKYAWAVTKAPVAKGALTTGGGTVPVPTHATKDVDGDADEQAAAAADAAVEAVGEVLSHL